MSSLMRPKKGIVYPESDGEPIAENTLQFRWIVTIEGNLEVLYAERDDVFVAGDLLWYPVEGEPTIRQAPDALVVYGRPPGHRGSYRQWEEGGIAPQVVWEILSPGNRHGQMIRKFQFYDKYGVEEYYVYDPDNGELSGYLRCDGRLEPIADMAGWVSPRMQIRLELIDGELHLFGPDGKPFLSFLELAAQKNLAQRQAEQAQRQAEQVQKEKADLELKTQEQSRRIEELQAQLKARGGLTGAG